MAYPVRQQGSSADRDPDEGADVLLLAVEQDLGDRNRFLE